MSEALPEKYYLIKFKILQEEYYTFWYTDDMDGFLLDANGMLKSFPTKEEAAAFAKEEGLWLDAEEFVISSAILRKMETRKINCKYFLDSWNAFSDLAHSINCRFMGDNREGIIQHIYVKLFYGCNILVKEDEEHYRPKWSKRERCWLAKVMKNGFRILAKGLNASWKTFCLLFMICVATGCGGRSASPGVAGEMPRAIHVLSGEDYHIALCGDGTVWSWGDNADGKLGMAVDVLMQPERVPGLENVVKIVDGGKDIFALTADGEVYYWGWALEDIRYEKRHADSMVSTPARLEGLEDIVDMDGKNCRLFALDKEGRLFSLGLWLDYPLRNAPAQVFSGCEELGRNIDRIVAGAGNYHYFIRKDGTVCSIMESFDDTFTPYMFIFPAEGEVRPGAETYARPEELESLSILNKASKVDHVVYYDLAGVGEVEAASADGYTVFLSRMDGTLWYWDSDRIKYHDDERALIDAESARESCAGRFVQIDIREILNVDGENPTPRIAAMESGLESTMFLTGDGSVFVSRYETCKVADVSCFVKSNPNPGKLPSVEIIGDMELKTLAFERLAIGNIVSISTDGEGDFTAVDADGGYYRFSATDSEAGRAFRKFPADEGGRRREYRLYAYRDGEMFCFEGFLSGLCGMCLWKAGH